jgi:virginiamycin B lyase
MTHTVEAQLFGIAAGPDGNLWFTEWKKIGKISPVTGIITEYNVSTSNGGITAGPDGCMWYTEWGNKIGKISPTTGVITEYPIGN